MAENDAIFALTHTKSGAKCSIHSYGATVISFQNEKGVECLYRSSIAKLDGSKAIRGGIPLVFPQFGVNEANVGMPQHGFLRRSTWELMESSKYDDDDSAGVSYKLQLKDVTEARGTALWGGDDKGIDCTCVYTIKISGMKMITTLQFTNTGTKAFEFQTLQHTYFRVHEHAALDATKCYVKGLDGYHLIDKISKTESTCGSDPVIIEKLTDRVYEPPSSGGKNQVNVVVGVGNGSTVNMIASGKVDGKDVPVACVVWNPFKENAAAMSDFADDEYHDMICVEPGILSGHSLEPGKVAELCQEIQM